MNKIKLVNIVVIAIALFIAFKIYKGQMAEVDQLKEQKAMEIKKNELFDELNDYNNRVNSYKNVLGNKDADMVMKTIGRIANESGVVISSIKPGAQKSNPDYVNLPFSVSVSANNYDLLGNFISRLESDSAVFLVVENVNVNSTGNASKLSANLEISTSMLNEK